MTTEMKTMMMDDSPVAIVRGEGRGGVLFIEGIIK